MPERVGDSKPLNSGSIARGFWRLFEGFDRVADRDTSFELGWMTD